MEANHDNLFGMQPGLYLPPPGDPLDDLVAAARYASMLDDIHNQSDHYPHNPYLGLTEMIDPALYGSENGRFVSIRKKCIADLTKKVPVEGVHAPDAALHDSSSFDLMVQAKFKTWDISTYSEKGSQQISLQDKVIDTTGQYVSLAGKGSHVPRGMFRCYHEGCGFRKPFKKREHLTRHEQTYGHPNLIVI